MQTGQWWENSRSTHRTVETKVKHNMFDLKTLSCHLARLAVQLVDSQTLWLYVVRTSSTDELYQTSHQTCYRYMPFIVPLKTSGKCLMIPSVTSLSCMKLALVSWSQPHHMYKSCECNLCTVSHFDNPQETALFHTKQDVHSTAIWSLLCNS